MNACKLQLEVTGVASPDVGTGEAQMLRKGYSAIRTSINKGDRAWTAGVT